MREHGTTHKPDPRAALINFKRSKDRKSKQDFHIILKSMNLRYTFSNSGCTKLLTIYNYTSGIVAHRKHTNLLKIENNLFHIMI